MQRTVILVIKITVDVELTDSILVGVVDPFRHPVSRCRSRMLEVVICLHHLVGYLLARHVSIQELTSQLGRQADKSLHLLIFVVF